MPRLFRMSLLTLPSLLLCMPVVAAPSALSLMRRSDKLHRLPLERVEALMVLQKRGGKPYTRRLVMTTAQDAKKGDKSVIRFAAPANIKNTAMLSVEDQKKDTDEQWLYLPAFRRTRRATSCCAARAVAQHNAG
ncbi:MAG: outer membrane lipoprotein-sorting protein [Deltaproteobacteria bacterium]|nr:outer membrane lipoprotein-sorting protein [Deltaproteobacteria bacterium]